jgi:hypothetical protein
MLVIVPSILLSGNRSQYMNDFVDWLIDWLIDCISRTRSSSTISKNYREMRRNVTKYGEVERTDRHVVFYTNYNVPTLFCNMYKSSVTRDTLLARYGYNTQSGIQTTTTPFEKAHCISLATRWASQQFSERTI